MTKLRFFVALWAAKLTIWLRRVTKAENSDIPGRVAMHLFPEFLSAIRKPAQVICITGTNGKTTVSNLVTDALRLAGHKVVNNSIGYNTRNGIALALIEETTLWGHPLADIAVLETDERSSKFLFSALRPDFLVCTNLTRDSIKFNGHPEFIAGLIDAGIQPETTLILNADDLICAALGGATNRKVMFGVAPQPGDTTTPSGAALDVLVCPNCQTTLIWDYWRYNHTGHAHCPACGFASPEADYLVTAIDPVARTFDLTHAAPATATAPVAEAQGLERYTYRLLVDNLANVYNQIAVTALLGEFGIPLARIASLFANINIVEKRWAETEINGTTIIRQLAKGQVGVACSRAFAYLAALPGRKAMTLNVDGRYYTEHDVENTCWAYDADYEFLANSGIEQIAVGGARRYDQMLRLLIAGVPATAIVSSAAERETADLLSLKGIDTVANVYDDDNIVVVGWAVQDRLIARLQAESSAELGGDNAH